MRFRKVRRLEEALDSKSMPSAEHRIKPSSSNTSHLNPLFIIPTSPTGAWLWSYARHAGDIAPRSSWIRDITMQRQNIEHIVAWLLDEEMLGGFHFNDRRYADDDLTLGSIDPYQIFRIFREIFSYAHDRGTPCHCIEYMIDQSHNLKPKIEAMIQTVMTAQELYRQGFTG